MLYCKVSSKGNPEETLLPDFAKSIAMKVIAGIRNPLLVKRAPAPIQLPWLP